MRKLGKFILTVTALGAAIGGLYILGKKKAQELEDEFTKDDEDFLSEDDGYSVPTECRDTVEDKDCVDISNDTSISSVVSDVVGHTLEKADPSTSGISLDSTVDAIVEAVKEADAAAKPLETATTENF